jgi:hypothetical protein
MGRAALLRRWVCWPRSNAALPSGKCADYYWGMYNTLKRILTRTPKLPVVAVQTRPYRSAPVLGRRNWCQRSHGTTSPDRNEPASEIV